MITFERVLVIKTTAQTAEFRPMGIVSEPSRHPKDVPFVVSFDGDVRFGGLSAHENPQISVKFHV